MKTYRLKRDGTIQVWSENWYSGKRPFEATPTTALVLAQQYGTKHEVEAMEKIVADRTKLEDDGE